MDNQIDYHHKAFFRASRESRGSERIVQTALLLSVILYCSAVVFELCCGNDLIPAAFPVQNAESWRTVLKIVLGILSAVTLLIAGYYGHLSLSRVSTDHRKMELFYAAMARQLDRFGQTEAVLTRIAREELTENGNWCSYQRDNAPDINI